MLLRMMSVRSVHGFLRADTKVGALYVSHTRALGHQSPCFLFGLIHAGSVCMVGEGRHSIQVGWIYMLQDNAVTEVRNIQFLSDK